MNGFGECVLAVEHDSHAHGQNGDGGEGIDRLADLEAEVPDCQREECGEEQAPADDIRVDLDVILVG